MCPVQRQRGVPLLGFPHAHSVNPHHLWTKPRVHDWFISTNVIPDYRLAAFLVGDYTLWFAVEERNEALWQVSGAVQRVFVAVLEFLARPPDGLRPRAFGSVLTRRRSRGYS